MTQLFHESASGILAKGAVHRMERTKQKPVHVALYKKRWVSSESTSLGRNVHDLTSNLVLIRSFLFSFDT